MTVLGAECFETVDFGGNIAYGATMTKYGAPYLKLHLFPPHSGFGAPAIYPEKIKSLPMLTMGGMLSAAIRADIAAICGCTAAADYQANTRAAAAKAAAVTCIYGDANIGGFTTTGCVGSRLRVTGRTNELVTFGLDMFGLTTTQGAATAGAVTDTEFFPFELGQNTIGADTLLGFDLTFDTGLVPVFAMDGLGPTDGYGEVADVGARCTLVSTLAMNSTALAEWAKYEGISAVAPTLTLVGTAASTWAIAVKGYYTDWDRTVVNGILAHRATITGHVVGTSMLNIT